MPFLVEEMPCKLCLQDKVLCKSHIIPELLYKGMYDPDRHYLIEMFPDEEKKPGRRFTGPYERVLCRDCEERLNKFECYAHKILWGGVELTVRRYPGQTCIDVFHGIDYRSFKLFQISILWRVMFLSKEGTLPIFWDDRYLPAYVRRLFGDLAKNVK